MPEKREEFCRKWRQQSAQAQNAKNLKDALQSLYFLDRYQYSDDYPVWDEIIFKFNLK